MNGSGRRPWLLVTPALFALVALFLLPLSLFFVMSFWKSSFIALTPAFQLGNYLKTFVEYWSSILFTFAIALAIGAITTGLAFGFAYVIRFRAGRFGPALLFIALVTMFGGYLVKVYAWKTILGRDGILNSALLWLGITDAPLSALLFNPGAVIVTLVHYLLPLAVLPIYGAMRGIDDTALAAAQDLGAGRWRAIRDIVLPQSRFGLLAAFAMTFLISAGDYVTPRLVGGPQSAMIGNFIEGQFGIRMNAPLGSAMSFITVALCAVFIGLLWLAMTRWLRPR